MSILPEDCLHLILQFLPLHFHSQPFQLVCLDFHMCHQNHSSKMARERMKVQCPRLERHFQERKSEILDEINWFRFGCREENQLNRMSDMDQTTQGIIRADAVAPKETFQESSWQNVNYFLSRGVNQLVSQLRRTKVHVDLSERIVLILASMCVVSFFEKGSFEKMPMANGMHLEFVNPITGGMESIVLTKWSAHLFVGFNMFVSLSNGTTVSFELMPFQKEVNVNPQTLRELCEYILGSHSGVAQHLLLNMLKSLGLSNAMKTFPFEPSRIRVDQVSNAEVRTILEEFEKRLSERIQDMEKVLCDGDTQNLDELRQRTSYKEDLFRITFRLSREFSAEYSA
mmetsp:Transcript_6458/g.24267  ORF Transcript_6458/g.24267 Transcript_6458/m.24267 type:complete len:342 (-) Transcript_6458:3080-4105(-)